MRLLRFALEHPLDGSREKYPGALFCCQLRDDQSMKNPEHVLLPFQASSLPPGPWLVFAPHADDETFGMGGSLLKAHDAGLETHVVVMTDGALGGTANDLVAIRGQEVQEAARLLGVASLQCWQEPDRGLRVDEHLIQQVIARVLALQPGSVFLPAMLEPHPDHRSTALLVWAALQRLQAESAAPQPYAYEITAQSPINRLIDVSAQMSRKQEVMAVYASQNHENDYPVLITALDRARTFTLPETVDYAEGFYCFEPQDLTHSLPQVMQRIIAAYFE